MVVTAPVLAQAAAQARIALTEVFALKVGQVLEALVAGRTGGGLTSLTIGGQTLVAHLPQPLAPGTRLELRVKSAGPSPELVIIAQKAPSGSAGTLAKAVPVTQPLVAVLPEEPPIPAIVESLPKLAARPSPPAAAATTIPARPDAPESQPPIALRPACPAPAPVPSGEGDLPQPAAPPAASVALTPAPLPPMPAPALSPAKAQVGDADRASPDRAPVVTAEPESLPQPTDPLAARPQPYVPPSAQGAAAALAEPEAAGPTMPVGPAALPPSGEARDRVGTRAAVAETAPAPPSMPAATPATAAIPATSPPQEMDTPLQSALPRSSPAPAETPAVPQVPGAPAATVAAEPLRPALSRGASPVPPAGPAPEAPTPAPEVPTPAPAPRLIYAPAAASTPPAPESNNAVVHPSAPQPVTPKAALAQMLPEAIAKQDSLGPLLATLAAVVQRPAALPQPVLAVALRVLAQRIAAPEGRLAPADLERAVVNSGVLLEAALARGEARPADAKVAVLGLRAALARWLGDASPSPAPPREPTPPPLRGLPLRADPVIPRDLPDAPRDIGRVLHEQADAAVARIKLMQLASLPDSDPRQPAPTLRVELPFLIGHELVMAQIQIGRDGARREPGRKRGWTVRFALNFSATGEVGAEIGLIGGALNVGLWAAAPETAAALRAGLPALSSAIAAIGLEPGALRVREGTPAAVRPASGQLLDSTS